MLENEVHPCREDYLLIAVSTVTDVQTYILILYNYKWILVYVAPGLLSRRESRKDLSALMYNMLVNYKLLFFTLHVARCSELREDASLR